jgi:hypothetical protein
MTETSETPPPRDLIDISAELRSIRDRMAKLSTDAVAERRALLERADEVIKEKGRLVNKTPGIRNRYRTA